jgi:hypothetical protein
VSRSRHLLTVPLLICLATAGCGQSDDRAAVRSVSDRFFASVDSGDGEAACAELSADARTELEGQEQRECRVAVTHLRLEGGAPAHIEVYLTNAKVDLPGGESAFLDRTQQGWRLSAIGCKPQRGRPADRPYDCELEA